MSGSSGVKPKLDTCGCCAPAPGQPAIFNPPGQPALAYRIGTYASFLDRMLSSLVYQAIPDGPNAGTCPLAALTTRNLDDPAVALLDAWAIVADVFTFYQERIANEGYLRTATERRSVLELAREIGYELSPGVAATTLLCFTVQVPPATPLPITIATGVKVQNVPAQGKLPQTFETVEDIPARPEWNAIKPRLTEPQTVALDMASIWFNGVATGFKPGDAVLIVTNDGQKMRRVAAVTPDNDAKMTNVELVTASAHARKPILVGEFGSAVGLRFIARTSSASASSGAAGVVSAGGGGSGFAVEHLMVGGTWRRKDVEVLKTSLGARLGAAMGGLLWQTGAPAPARQTGAFAMRERVAIFGHNAPPNSALYSNLFKPDNSRLYPNPWDDPEMSIWQDPMMSPIDYYDDADLYLEREVAGILPDSWIVLELPGDNFGYYRVQAAADGSRTGFALSGKATGLKLWSASGSALGNNTTDKPEAFTFRRTTVYCRSERLALAQMPIADAVAGMAIDLDVAADDFYPGQTIIVSGEVSDQPGVSASEPATVAEVFQTGGAQAYTTLTLRAKLTNSYLRKTVTVNANVAHATHGETVNEVLGSGDSSQAHQSFTLKKPPLTYVPAVTPSGAQSTLRVGVNGTRWAESASLYGLDARAEKYIVRLDNDAKPTITFGDGLSGERLPTGVENVAAVYRSGIGSAGNVGAGSLTLLQSQPFGVRAVTNTIAATGGAAPEGLDEARVNAPLKVLTLDRVVALEDYEDFARAFAGVGKARAAVLWSGESRLVHLTIGGAGGAQIDSSSPLPGRLQSAIAEFGDPVQEVRIAGFTQLTFSVEATVIVDPRRETGAVLGAVDAALRAAFSFARRDFAQPVTGAEVTSVAQSVDGVVAVNLQTLAMDSLAPILRLILPSLVRMAPQFVLKFTPLLLSALSFTGPVLTVYQPPVDRVLFARPARWEGGAIGPAELLLVNQSGITLHGKNP